MMLDAMISFISWLTNSFYRYFTGKDMVEWILANLRTGSNDTCVIFSLLSAVIEC